MIWMREKKNKNINPEPNSQPATQPVKTKKGKKRAVLILVLAAVVLLAVFVALPLFNWFGPGRAESSSAFYTRIAENYPEVTFDEEEGLLFVNNELVVMTAADADRADAEALAASYDAQIADAMEDIGVYRLRFNKNMTLSELERAQTKLKKEALVEEVHINTALDVTGDAEEGEIEKKDPVYPEDPWNGASWNMDVPRGENWGMEAIHAPAAWGYLSELSEVNVGLIDTMVNNQHEDIEAKTYVAAENSSGKETVQEITTSNAAPGDHGTHVAGTIGASWNKTGVTGVMGDKGNLYYCLGNTSGGYYTPYEYLRAIKALVDRNVRAINISQNTGRTLCYAASQGNEKAIKQLQTSADTMESGLKRLIQANNEKKRPDFVLCMAAGNVNSIKYYKSIFGEYGYRDYELWPWEYGGGESGGALAKYNNFINLIDDKAVKDRIIVVGSIGINAKNSTDSETRYSYSTFSNVGDRVDVVAPGEDIYSSVVSGYLLMSGTSMAAPHATGVAGLLFAANPDLTGPQVKQLMIASTSGRFYYEDGSSGLINAEKAVVSGLQTEKKSVSSVINNQTNSGLDLCFVVDTTGSMKDDIDNAKENMSKILAQLSEKSAGYRVALIDYRDFPDRSGSDKDYAARIQLKFSDNADTITRAINGLTLGDGGDNAETVYSALMKAVELDWNPASQKVIIVLGDAPPLDPEPNTQYTLDEVIAALYNADLAIDMENSDHRVLGDAEDSAITVYSIGTSASDSAADYFTQIAEQTGGAYTGVDDASKVSDAIMDSIDQIEMKPVGNATVSFGEDCTGEMVEVYRDGVYQFEVRADENGSARLEDMELGDYDWQITRLGKRGGFEIESAKRWANATHDDSWYSFALAIWYRHRVELIGGAVLAVVVLIVLIVVVKKIKKYCRKRAAVKAEAVKERQEAAETAVPLDPPSPAAPSPTPESPASSPAAPVSSLDVPTSAPASPMPTSAASATKSSYTCPACGAVFDRPHAFCTKCGTKMQP